MEASPGQDEEYSTDRITRLLRTPRFSVSDPSTRRPDWTQAQDRCRTGLRLDKNENVDPLMVGLVGRILSEVQPSAATSYPDCAPLYRALASSAGVDMTQLVVGAGAEGLIRSVFEAFVGPGDVVAHTAPSYAMYEVYVRMFGARSCPVEYEASPLGPKLEADGLLETIRTKSPRLLCLPNPDSPTGAVLEPEEMIEVVSRGRESGCLVLVDEAYYPYHLDSVAGLVDLFDNLVVVRTFSKAWCLPGLRVGYAITGPEVADVLHRVRSGYEVHQIAVDVATCLLTHEKEMLASVDRILSGRDYFRTEMLALGLTAPTTATNFCLVELGSSLTEVKRRLRGLVEFRSAFDHPSMSGLSRFTAATTEQIEPVVEVIRQVVDGSSVT